MVAGSESVTVGTVVKVIEVLAAVESAGRLRVTCVAESTLNIVVPLGMRAPVAIIPALKDAVEAIPVTTALAAVVDPVSVYEVGDVIPETVVPY